MKGIAFLPGFISAAITLGMILPVNSQVTSDGTTNTNVNSIGNNFTILNGIQRGGNLFHSFGEFSIPTGGSATFQNPSAIENIINRVTGGNISNIDGLIKSQGSANLFLINPAGIVFGENARLDIGGSFLGSTAESILFEDGFEFSAVNAQAEPLLTVSVPLGLQYGTNPSSINVSGANLTVNSGQNLALLGGDVTISNSEIIAPGGNIQIGAISPSGMRSANAANNFLDLNQDGTINSTNTGNLQNIQLDQNTTLNISGFTNGLITLLGNNINIDNESKLIADALENTPAGGIDIQATDTFSLKGGSSLSATTTNVGNTGIINIVGNSVEIDQANIDNTTSGAGDAGEFNINATNSFTMQNSEMGNGTSGEGKAGNINYRANTIFINSSGFGNGTTSSGNAGNINITADNLTMTQGGFGTDTNGSGNAGNINLTIANEISLEQSGFGAATNSSGRGGIINIQAGKLTMFQSGFGANVRGTGDGGEININVEDTIFARQSGFGTDNFGEGKTANINVTAGSIILDDAGFGVSTQGSRDAGIVTVIADSIVLNEGRIDSEGTIDSTGNAGEINITVGSLILNEGGIGAEAKGKGDGRGGQITIQADTISLNEQGNDVLRSEIDSQSLGSGDSGDITLITRELNINGGIISVANFGSGEGGNIEIEADSINLTQQGTIFAANGTGSTGTGSNVEINANNLVLQDSSNITVATGGEAIGGNLLLSVDNIKLLSGSQINSSSLPEIAFNAEETFIFFGEEAANLELITPTLLQGAIYGNAGNVEIYANQVTVQGADADGNVSSIAAFSQTNAAAGSVEINTNTLKVNDGGQINVSGLGTGNAGNLDIHANSIKLDNTASLNAEANTGNQANLNLTSQLLLLRNGSKITTNATGTANGGNININSAIIAGFENSDIVANAEKGKGGNINITTQGIFGLQFRDELTEESDITASSEFGVNGTVEINNISIDPNSGLIELPTEVTDPSKQIANGCSSNNESSFVATGRGGMPQNPTESVDLNPTWSDIRDLSAFRQQRKNNTVVNTQISNPPAIVEATGLIRNANGVIEFVVLENTPLRNKQVAECSGIST